VGDDVFVVDKVKVDVPLHAIDLLRSVGVAVVVPVNELVAISVNVGTVNAQLCEIDRVLVTLEVPVCDLLAGALSVVLAVGLPAPVPLALTELLKTKVRVGLRDNDRDVATDSVAVSLSVSHSTSRRHETYPRLFPRSGLHRPPSAALCTPHQWHSSAPSHTSRRQISPPHDAAHRSRASSPRATQYSTLPGAPHHSHSAWIDRIWQIPGSSGPTVGHSVWQLRGLSVQYPSSGHHLQSALAVHTPVPSGSSDAGVHVGQHVPALGWHTPIDVLDGHHWHSVL
jgi:hypothetical protein